MFKEIFSTNIIWFFGIGLMVLLVLFVLRSYDSSKQGNHVFVKQENGEYTLVVNQSPFFVKGIGVGKAFGLRGERYLTMASELGANTVRTWGTDQGTKKYLDEAHKNNLYVNAGIWINYADKEGKYSYLKDSDYLKQKTEETLQYVKRFKNHPSILMWNIGNEALHFTKSEEERIALCRYLEKLIQKVKQEDPNHPVVYAAASPQTFPYLTKYVPSLDILGANVYGSVLYVHSSWEAQDFDGPYLITEFGPVGPWDLPKDPNARVLEPPNHAKAMSYRFHWQMIRDYAGSNIGGFAFHLGETTQETLTYWNINDSNRHTQSSLMIQSLYNEKQIMNHAPRIFNIDIDKQIYTSGEGISLQVEAKDPEGGPLSYSYRMSTCLEGVLKYEVNREIACRIDGEGPEVKVYFDEEPGIYRVYATVIDDTGNATTSSRTFRLKNG